MIRNKFDSIFESGQSICMIDLVRSEMSQRKENCLHYGVIHTQGSSFSPNRKVICHNCNEELAYKDIISNPNFHKSYIKRGRKATYDDLFGNMNNNYGNNQKIRTTHYNNQKYDLLEETGGYRRRLRNTGKERVYQFDRLPLLLKYPLNEEEERLRRAGKVKCMIRLVFRTNRNHPFDICKIIPQNIRTHEFLFLIFDELAYDIENQHFTPEDHFNELMELEKIEIAQEYFRSEEDYLKIDGTYEFNIEDDLNEEKNRENNRNFMTLFYYFKIHYPDIMKNRIPQMNINTVFLPHD